MTRGEFIDVSRRNHRRQNWWGVALMFVIVVGASLGAALVKFLDFENPTPGKVIAFIVFSALIGIAAVLMTRFSFKEQPKCSHCGKSLAGFHANIVIASGRCGFCGEGIVSD